MSTNYYGGIGSRLFAYLIDLAICFAFSALINISVGMKQASLTSINHPRTFFVFLLSFGFVFFYFTILQAQFRGTFGKHAMGLILVDARSLNNITVGQSIGRWLMAIPSTLVFFLGYLGLATNGRRQGWHDRACDTVVVKKSSYKALQQEQGIFSSDRRELGVHIA